MLVEDMRRYEEYIRFIYYRALRATYYPRLFSNGGFGTIPVDKFPLHSLPSLSCLLEIGPAAPIPAALIPAAPISASLIPDMIPASPKPASLIRVQEQVPSHLGAC